MSTPLKWGSSFDTKFTTIQEELEILKYISGDSGGSYIPRSKQDRKY
jgi:hypothetical protein